MIIFLFTPLFSNLLQKHQRGTLKQLKIVRILQTFYFCCIPVKFKLKTYLMLGWSIPNSPHIHIDAGTNHGSEWQIFGLFIISIQWNCTFQYLKYLSKPQIGSIGVKNNLKVGPILTEWPQGEKITSYCTEEENVWRKHFISYGRKRKCAGRL